MKRKNLKSTSSREYTKQQQQKKTILTFIKMHKAKQQKKKQNFINMIIYKYEE